MHLAGTHESKVSLSPQSRRPWPPGSQKGPSYSRAENNLLENQSLLFYQLTLPDLLQDNCWLICEGCFFPSSLWQLLLCFFQVCFLATTQQLASQGAARHWSSWWDALSYSLTCEELLQLTKYKHFVNLTDMCAVYAFTKPRKTDSQEFNNFLIISRISLRGRLHFKLFLYLHMKELFIRYSQKIALHLLSVYKPFRKQELADV